MGLSTEGIIDAYFNEDNKLVEHQINSYNYYVDEIIPQILSQYFPVIMTFNDDSCVINKIELDIKNMKVGKPLLIENNGCSKLMTPNMARIRNSTYLSPIVVDFISRVTINSDGIAVKLEDKIIPNIVIGKIPIMVKSKYCILNQKGYEDECIYDLG